MSARRTPRPIPSTRDLGMPRPPSNLRETIDRVRREQLFENTVHRRALPKIVWVLLAPFIVLALYLALAVVVSVGAAIERALAGG